MKRLLLFCAAALWASTAAFAQAPLPSSRGGTANDLSAATAGHVPLFCSVNGTIGQCDSGATIPGSQLPIATTGALGAIKPDGTTLSTNGSTGVTSVVSLPTLIGTFTSDGALGALPANTLINNCLFRETAGNPVTVTLGTSSGGNQILGSTSVPASSNIPIDLANLTSASFTTSQTVYIHSPAWGSPGASITAKCWIEY